MDLLADRPGLNKSQIADELDLDLNAVRFHLERLAAVDLVEMRASPRQGEVVCFLPSNVELWEEPSTQILFGGSRVREAAILILEQPGITAEEIGEAMELSSGGVHHHLSVLLDRNLVERFRLGRAYRYYPTPTLEGWYEHVRERSLR